MREGEGDEIAASIVTASILPESATETGEGKGQAVITVPQVAVTVVTPQKTRGPNGWKHAGEKDEGAGGASGARGPGGIAGGGETIGTGETVGTEMAKSKEQAASVVNEDSASVSTAATTHRTSRRASRRSRRKAAQKLAEQKRRDDALLMLSQQAAYARGGMPMPMYYSRSQQKGQGQQQVGGAAGQQRGAAGQQGGANQARAADSRHMFAHTTDVRFVDQLGATFGAIGARLHRAESMVQELNLRLVQERAERMQLIEAHLSLLRGLYTARSLSELRSSREVFRPLGNTDSLRPDRALNSFKPPTSRREGAGFVTPMSSRPSTPTRADAADKKADAATKAAGGDGKEKSAVGGEASGGQEVGAGDMKGAMSAEALLTDKRPESLNGEAQSQCSQQVQISDTRSVSSATLVGGIGASAAGIDYQGSTVGMQQPAAAYFPGGMPMSGAVEFPMALQGQLPFQVPQQQINAFSAQFQQQQQSMYPQQMGVFGGFDPQGQFKMVPMPQTFQPIQPQQQAVQQQMAYAPADSRTSYYYQVPQTRMPGIAGETFSDNISMSGSIQTQ